MSYEIPDPLPLRTITVPREVTQVDGCDCGGLTSHVVIGFRNKACSIWDLPPDEAKRAIDDALAREQAFGDALNAKLRAALGGKP